MRTRINRELKNVEEPPKLEFISVLGRGGFGYVSLMGDPKTRQLYAEKSSSLDLIKSLEKEHRIMLRFRNHPRIVQATCPKIHIGFNPERCYIYMEFASKGTLVNVLSTFRGNPMPEIMIGRFTHMILQGLLALHSNGYVHCDIKPANVLLFPSKVVGESLAVKLADFGLSKEPWNNDPRDFCGGTREYMSPEAVSRNGVVGPDFDIWALGCVVLEMFGVKPVKMRGMYNWEVPRFVSLVACDFLSRCSEIPTRRATAAELLKHPFVAPRRVMVAPQRPEMVPSVTSYKTILTRPKPGQGGEVMKMVPKFQDLKI